MAIGSLGAGSGIDLESLVSDMVSARRDTKVKLYENKLTGYEAELSALGSVGSAIDNFKNFVQTLNDDALFSGRNAIVEQKDEKESFVVTADQTASNDTYSIQVNQLAKGSRLVSDITSFSSRDEKVTSSGGKLKLTAGDQKLEMEVKPNTTLSKLREQINSEGKDFGISANLVDDGDGHMFFTITSTKTGAGNTLKIDSSNLTLDSAALGGFFPGLSVPAGGEAQDAIITVDGIRVRSESNDFNEAVAGLSIRALDVSKEPEKVEVSYNKEKVEETIQGFVGSYNELIAVFKQNTAKGAVLNGNSMIRNLSTSLAGDLMSNHASEGSAFTSIFDVGVELLDNGTLAYNSDKFNRAVETDFDGVASLFVGKNGLAKSLDGLLESYAGPRGMNNTLKDSVSKSISSTEESLSDYEARMEKYEASLRSKFTNLDSQLANMNAQGNYLNSMLDQL
ncbi:MULTISPECIES: flagellar filament capping protein FliD [Marinomonas]|uniref:Flagellar hook-associated protein 2 n=1 Tax=Marinomonas arctica TaxID=383750 RepID=A0A7H1J3P6_9GAMM|nr:MULTISPECIES: flagellar filament capping protein FliD [Marinomonas]MCS7487010.1 flagellar hook-associated protein [Marinomonas sp. BSi20414]QNT05112.1 flagellar filament capping protein FliD [Marinomonas arctica]GGN16051.1 flagellar hook-associated protein 2 [Marinomonas arctica]